MQGQAKDVEGLRAYIAALEKRPLLEEAFAQASPLQWDAKGLNILDLTAAPAGLLQEVFTDEVVLAYTRAHTSSDARWQRLRRFFRWQLDPAHNRVTLDAVDGLRVAERLVEARGLDRQGALGAHCACVHWPTRQTAGGKESESVPGYEREVPRSTTKVAGRVARFVRSATNVGCAMAAGGGSARRPWRARRPRRRP